MLRPVPRRPAPQSAPYVRCANAMLLPFRFLQRVKTARPPQPGASGTLGWIRGRPRHPLSAEPRDSVVGRADSSTAPPIHANREFSLQLLLVDMNTAGEGRAPEPVNAMRGSNNAACSL